MKDLNKKSFAVGFLSASLIGTLAYFLVPVVANPFPPVVCITFPCPQISRVSISHLVTDAPRYIKQLEERMRKQQEIIIKFERQ